MPSLSQSEQDLDMGRSPLPHFTGALRGLSHGPGTCSHATAWFTRMPVMCRSLLQTAPGRAGHELCPMPSRSLWDRTALRAAPKS